MKALKTILAAMLALPAVGHAQGAPTTEPRGVTLKLFVIDTQGAQVGAGSRQVHIGGQAHNTYTTDADGARTLTLAPGTYPLDVLGATMCSSSFTVTPGQDTVVRLVIPSSAGQKKCGVAKEVAEAAAAASRPITQ